MFILPIIFINIIFILFPLFSYFLFTIYRKDIGKKVDNILFDLALYTSVYLILSYNHGSDTNIIATFITIPLLIAYLKNKKESYVIISLVIGLYYYSLNINIILIILELTAYFLGYLILLNRNQLFYRNINIFLVIKVIFLVMIINNLKIYLIADIPIILQVILLSLSFIVVANLICSLLKRCDEIIDIHDSIKELEEQKIIRESLFKITHEIKNPIAVCKGYLDMLDIDNKEDSRKYIGIIKQEIDRTITLMDDFLNLTKLDVKTTKMDIIILLDDICEIVKILIRSSNIAFDYNVDEKEIYIKGDYNRLKQVFLNIIKNAIEAIESSQKGLIKLIINDKANNIKITIIDNGIGMDKTTLKKIGEPFYTTKKGGTGLGVRLSKEIIEGHNGWIKYKSIKGIGTKVIICLPIIKNPI